MRDRVGIDQGDHLVGLVQAGNRLHQAAALEAARREPLGKRIDPQPNLPPLPNHGIDDRPGRIVLAVHHDPHVVVRVVLVEQRFEAGGQERIGPAQAEHDGRLGARRPIAAAARSQQGQHKAHDQESLACHQPHENPEQYHGRAD